MRIFSVDESCFWSNDEFRGNGKKVTVLLHDIGIELGTNFGRRDWAGVRSHHPERSEVFVRECIVYNTLASMAI
jgi:hypothetical protein